jgi:hypothetical protein
MPPPVRSTSPGGRGRREEFDLGVATLLLAENELETDVALAGVGTEAGRGEGDTPRELHLARVRFLAEVGVLERGEDATAATQRFIPALLPVLKLGAKLACPTIVNALSSHVGRMIKPYVGEQSRPMARAIGLRSSGSSVKLPAKLGPVVRLPGRVRRGPSVAPGASGNDESAAGDAATTLWPALLCAGRDRFEPATSSVSAKSRERLCGRSSSQVTLDARPEVAVSALLTFSYVLSCVPNLWAGTQDIAEPDVPSSQPEPLSRCCDGGVTSPPVRSLGDLHGVAPDTMPKGVGHDGRC